MWAIGKVLLDYLRGIDGDILFGNGVFILAVVNKVFKGNELFLGWVLITLF